MTKYPDILIAKKGKEDRKEREEVMGLLPEVRWETTRRPEVRVLALLRTIAGLLGTKARSLPTKVGL